MAKKGKSPPNKQEEGKKTLGALNALHKAHIVDRRIYDFAEVIPTGSVVLDTITGIGGYPLGRIVEIWGAEGVSKTTAALHACAACQAKGKAVVYFDFEGAFDNGYAAEIGVDIYDSSKFVYFEPETFEEAQPLIQDYSSIGEVGLVVLDSVSAMTPEAAFGDTMPIGLLARKLSNFLSVLVKVLRRNRTACIAVNQVRMKVATNKYERTEEYSTGGKALQFYNSMKIKLTRRRAFKDTVKNIITNMPEERITRALVKAEVVKNKFAPPFVVGDYWVHFGKGIDNGASVYDMALGRGVFDVAGSWVTFHVPWEGKPAGEFKMQGIDNVRALVSEDAKLQGLCMEAMDLKMSDSEKKAAKSKESKVKKSLKDDPNFVEI